MTKIKCVINGEVTEIEVEDSFATAYLEIDAESKRNEWKHERWATRHSCSLERITDNGFQIAAPDDVEEEAEKAEEHAALKAAIAELTPEQQELIRRVYFNDEEEQKIAQELGVSKQAINQRVMRTLAALKKILKKN